MCLHEKTIVLVKELKEKHNSDLQTEGKLFSSGDGAKYKVRHVMKRGVSGLVLCRVPHDTVGERSTYHLFLMESKELTLERAAGRLFVSTALPASP